MVYIFSSGFCKWISPLKLKKKSREPRVWVDLYSYSRFLTIEIATIITTIGKTYLTCPKTIASKASKNSPTTPAKLKKLRADRVPIINKKIASKETLEKSLQLLNPICPHITEELWEKLENTNLISTSKWPKIKEIKESQNNEENLNEKLITQINKLIEKVNDKEKIFIYIMPFEIEKIDKKTIKKETGKEIEIFATNNKNKYDPENKAKKAKPKMPSIYLE